MTLLESRAAQLAHILSRFRIKTEGLDHISAGPQATRFVFLPAGDQQPAKIAALADDIALALGVPSVRMLCPIPGTMTFGIEVPNDTPQQVTFDQVYASDAFQNSKDPLRLVLGQDMAGQDRIIELSRAPHLLMAGQTCSGKTTALHCMIQSLCKGTAPEDVQLVLIDPKNCEFGIYANSPRLYLPVVTDAKQGADTFAALEQEMLRRLELLARAGARDIAAYNRSSDTQLPRIVVFVDELAPLMTCSAASLESAIARLGRGARAAGIHLVLATAEAKSTILTGVIRANIPARIAFCVKSRVESRYILDGPGAEKLLCKGDLLYQALGARYAERVQGAIVLH